MAAETQQWPKVMFGDVLRFGTGAIPFLIKNQEDITLFKQD